MLSIFFSRFFVFFVSFPTGLVRLYIAGLPLRSCWTSGPPSEGGGEGSSQCPFFISGSSGIRTHFLLITVQTLYRYPITIRLNPCQRQSKVHLKRERPFPNVGVSDLLTNVIHEVINPKSVLNMSVSVNFK